MARGTRKGTCERLVCFPEADDSIGVEPDRLRRYASGRPCKRQSPRQDRVSQLARLVEADRRWESKPRSRTPDVSDDFSRKRGVTPTKINRGAEERACEATCGPEHQKWRWLTHPQEQTCEGPENEPRSAAGRNEEGGISKNVRPGKAACERSPLRVAEHRADEGRDGA